MKILALFILISLSAAAEEVELSTVFGNSDYLNKQIELVGFLYSPPQSPPDSSEAAPLPIAYFYSSEQAFDRVGLINVNRRIKLYYGEAYGIQIKSNENEFTKITMLIPRNGEKVGAIDGL